MRSSCTKEPLTKVNPALQPLEFDADGVMLDNRISRAIIDAMSNPWIETETIVAIYKNGYDGGYVPTLNLLIKMIKHNPFVDVNERVEIACRLNELGVRIEQRGDGSVILSDAYDIYVDTDRFWSLRTALNPVLSKKVTQLVWDYSAPPAFNYPVQFDVTYRSVNSPVKSAIYDALIDHTTAPATIATILANAYDFGYVKVLNHIIQDINQRYPLGVLDINAETTRLLNKRNIQCRQEPDKTVTLAGTETIFYNVARFREFGPELYRLLPAELVKIVVDYEAEFCVLEENQGLIMEALSESAHDLAFKRQIFVEAVRQDRAVAMNTLKFTLNKLLVQFINAGNIINLHSVDLSGLHLPWVTLGSADLRQAKLQGACLVEGYFMRAKLMGADLTCADLRKAKLHFANLSGAILINANLEGAMLIDANLTNTVFTGARLKGARLNMSDLSRADLQGVDLGETDLSGCILTDTKLGKPVQTL